MDSTRFALLAGLTAALMGCGGGGGGGGGGTPAVPTPAPTITSFTPVAGGPVGSIVRVVGTNLSGTSAVFFGGTSQPVFSLVAPNEIATSVPSGASTGPIQITTPGGVATSAVFTVVPIPTITAVSPAGGSGVGLPISIDGSGLGGATSVSFNGTPQPAFSVSSSTRIQTTVPPGASSGPIQVTTPGGVATSATFTIIPTPSIASVSPPGGAGVGLPVTINGTNLGGATLVSFQGAAQPTFTVVSSTRIQTTVPAGASTGQVQVMTPGGSATSATFTILPTPAIMSVSPAGGAGVGLPVTIDGTALGGATAVSFNGTAQPTFTVALSTRIETTVPAGATSGPIQVTTPGGVATSATFTVVPTPTITTVLPAGGAGVGLPVVIEGTDLTGSSAVSFNGTAQPAFTVLSNTRVETTVPAGATSGVIQLLTPGGAAASVPFTIVPTPTITSVSPPGGSTVGPPVTIGGTGLTGATAVSFNGTAQTTFTVMSDTQIVTKVPGGATTGQVVVTTPGGTAASTSYTVIQTPPTLTSSLGVDVQAQRLRTLVFQVTADHYTPVNLRLLNPPSGSCFQPAEDATGPVTRTFRWVLVGFQSGRYTLHFQATCDAFPALRTSLQVEVHITMGGVLRVADVTGDGLNDLIVGAPRADEGDINTGALYVWKGGAGGPTAQPDLELRVPDPGADLGGQHSEGSDAVSLEDVTGDGVRDIVAVCPLANGTRGAVLVWVGGPALASGPDFILTDPSAQADGRFSEAAGHGHQIVDVTGDGIADILVNGRSATVDGRVSAGVIRIWRGGPSLSSTVDFRLGAYAGAQMGFARWLGFQVADVTGDGVLDVLGGAQNGSAVYLWRGGTTFSPLPDAILGGPSLLAGGGYQAVDLTGDGVLDVVAGTPNTTSGGVVHLWRGGTTLIANPAGALMTLSVPGALPADQLTADGFSIADVTGDGLPDLVVGTPTASIGGASNCGAIYVWSGGAITASPTIALTVPGAIANDLLPLVNNNCGNSMLFEDVTGDGLLDVIAAASFANRGGLTDTGAVYVWAGGPSLTASPTASLFVPGSRAGDSLGYLNGQAFQVVDVTGDGVRDIVTGSYMADRAGVQDSGEAYVWEGGTFAFHALSPASPRIDDRLGYMGLASLGVQCEDVTGDGLADVVVGAAFTDVGAVTDAGAAYIWVGGTLTTLPTWTLSVPSAVTNARLGADLLFGFNQGLLLRDVTGDGTLDVLGITPWARGEFGNIYLWRGGATIQASPDVTLAGPDEQASFGSTQQEGSAVPVADLTGDGVADIVVGACLKDTTAVDAGALYFWNGGPTITGAADRILTVPGATAGDRLAGR